MTTGAIKKERLRYGYLIGLALFQRGRGFSTPVDLAFSRDSKMYVVSRSIARPSPDQGGIRIGICSPDYQAEYFTEFSGYGSGDGQCIWPTALAFDRDDVLYMADEHLNRITLFDKEGSFLGKWGTSGDGDGQLNGPSSMVFDGDDNLYITDNLNNRVQKFSKDGRFLAKFGSFGSGDGELYLPWGVTVDGEGNVYVADWRNDRIQKFTAEGRFLTKFGSFGGGDDRLNRPAHLAVDSEGYMYVADWGNERVLVLDPGGGLVQKLRGEAGLSKWAEEYFESNVDEAEARSRANLEPDLGIDDPWEESSFVEKYFWGPISVKLDAQEKVFVTESNRHRVQIYERV